VTRTFIPQPILDAAHARAAARAARDWATADRLRDEIEAAGWRVVDAGTDFRLELADPPDLEIGGTVRYGRSSAVPSRLDEPASGTASIILVAGEDVGDLARATRGILQHAPEGVGVVIVADDPGTAMTEHLSAPPVGIEVIWTSERLGTGAAWNIGLRRATAGVVALMDPGIELQGDAITPLVRALDDPAVAIAGPFGLRSGDLRRFDETTLAGPAAAIEGYLLAFRRADATARMPIDEGFRFYRNLDIWWSFELRDAGPDRPPRDAIVVPGLPLVRHEHRGWTALEPAERERLSKRNFYRLLDRFRDRDDLAVEGDAG
jgi:hypothetical protein